MVSSTIVAIKEQIEKERSALRAKANGLEAELAGVEAQLNSLSKALAALNGEEASALAKKPSVRKRADKPAAGKAQVSRIIAAVLSEVDVLEEAALREQVEAKLTASGFSRMGFALRFKEALQEPHFVDTADGISLRQKKVVLPR